MLKVVGASWFQTRISTYILVAVILIGIGTILLGEFGRYENDGTYAATVTWKHGSGYQVKYWGQGNDLSLIPLRAARAYYKTGMLDSGWSILEIETSPDFDDSVQAYAAGLVEGSLTWQLIYHHWYNTVRAACPPNSALCKKMRKYLRDNADHARKSARRWSEDDPFWHMIHLYYVQLDGLIAGWRHAVQRSHHQGALIDPEDFLWLAMASDLPDLERANNGSNPRVVSAGMVVLKAIERKPFEPLMALAHNTAAPYSKMLRLLKRYKFAYRTSPDKKSAKVPGRAIVMTSYPGALSSQDESYLVSGEDAELLVAGTPLLIDDGILSSRLQVKDRVMSAGRIMAANRLSTTGLGWSRILERYNSGTANRQWLSVEPSNGEIGLIEQSPGFTQHTDRTEDFSKSGFLACTGVPFSSTIRQEHNVDVDDNDGYRDSDKTADTAVIRAEILSQRQIDVTSVDAFRDLMSGRFGEDTSSSSSQEEKEGEQPTVVPIVESDNAASIAPIDGIGQFLAYRGDLSPVLSRPVGVIDSKLFLFDAAGVQSFEARSGPARRRDAPPFDWTATFPNASHIGQADVFYFEPVKPNWVWIT